MKSRHLSLDLVSTLPQGIIENILCLLPIQMAARTSILSKEWRYHWTKIPKLVFYEYTVEETFDNGNERIRKARRSRLFNAINQVLLEHRGPILDFTLHLKTDDFYDENDEIDSFLEKKIDRIITHLLRNNTVKKLRLDLGGETNLPLSVFSLHQLTHLYLHDCVIFYEQTINGFDSLTTLYLDNVIIEQETLLYLLSSCPLLTHLSLLILEADSILADDFSTITKLFESLPLIEHLTIYISVITCFVQDKVPRNLPISLIHLKSFSSAYLSFMDKYGLPFIVLLIRCSPNLEKIKLQMSGLLAEQHSASEIDSVSLKDYSDIWLEHLNELEMEDFTDVKPELEFVRLILARSPVLKKVVLVIHNRVTKDEELKMLRTLLRSPRASPMVEIIVERRVGRDLLYLL